MTAIFAALGAFFNAVRGGLLAVPQAKLLNVLAFAGVCAFIVPFWWQIPLCGLAMWAGQQPSVGEIVGEEGILGGHVSAHWWAILRGAYWGGLIGLALWSPWPLLAGCFYGLGYQIGRWAELYSPRANGWMIGEIIFGAILWGSCFL